MCEENGQKNHKRKIGLGNKWGKMMCNKRNADNANVRERRPVLSGFSSRTKHILCF